jgi:hypothetical protein
LAKSNASNVKVFAPHRGKTYLTRWFFLDVIVRDTTRVVSEMFENMSKNCGNFVIYLTADSS